MAKVEEENNQRNSSELAKVNKSLAVVEDGGKPENPIVAWLRQKGFSDEAIAAFMSGKPIMMNVVYEISPGVDIVEEHWQGKDTPKETPKE